MVIEPQFLHLPIDAGGYILCSFPAIIFLACLTVLGVNFFPGRVAIIPSKMYTSNQLWILIKCNYASNISWGLLTLKK